MSDLVSYDSSVFNAATPPKGWERATCGAYLALGAAAALPSRGSAAQAATRVESPVDHDAVLDVLHDQGKATARIEFTVWFNDAIVFTLGADGKREAKPFRVLQKGNTMVVECRSADDKPVTAGTLYPRFTDARTHHPLDDLLFDMEKRK